MFSPLLRPVFRLVRVGLHRRRRDADFGFPLVLQVFDDVMEAEANATLANDWVHAEVVKNPKRFGGERRSKLASRRRR